MKFRIKSKKDKEEEQKEEVEESEEKEVEETEEKEVEPKEEVEKVEEKVEEKVAEETESEEEIKEGDLLTIDILKSLGNMQGKIIEEPISYLKVPLEINKKKIIWEFSLKDHKQSGKLANVYGNDTRAWIDKMIYFNIIEDEEGNELIDGSFKPKKKVVFKLEKKKK